MASDLDAVLSMMNDAEATAARAAAYRLGGVAAIVDLTPANQPIFCPACDGRGKMGSPVALFCRACGGTGVAYLSVRKSPDGKVLTFWLGAAADAIGPTP